MIRGPSEFQLQRQHFEWPHRERQEQRVPGSDPGKVLLLVLQQGAADELRRGRALWNSQLQRPSSAAARRFLETLTGRGGASMLCVIKDCGDEGIGLLSFPKRGDIIAPVN